MFQRICLVHYHEIGLKGHNRSNFEIRLLKNLEFLLKEYPLVTIKRISGRLCLFIKEGTDYDTSLALAERAARVPGVARVSCGFKCERELESIYAASDVAIQEAGEFKSFKVDARRNHTDFPINSMEINRLVGSYLCERYPDKTVKMKNPDVTAYVEVVQSSAYAYSYTIPGIGGLPVGSSGKVMCLLSAGIDSPVALWRMAKRGAICLAIHFSGYPQTAETSRYLVEDICGVLERSGCISRLHVVSFGDYQREIAAVVAPELRVIIYRRLMLKVAEALSIREGAQALVTGESLGQVASQTLDNLSVTDAAVSLPIFRPLIGSDKQEIIRDAQRIETFDISSQDAPDCCTLFMPRNPETHAKLPIVLKEEAKLPLDVWVENILDALDTVEFASASSKQKRVR